ncbi:MAG: aldo/keto reductase [Bacteroidota bacterium]
MKFQRLGNAGIFVSDLCLGTMIFGETEGRGTSEEVAISMIHQYLDAGGNHIDTANAYVGGLSEEITGKAIADRRSSVILATKYNFPIHRGPNDYGASRWNLIQSLEGSLRRLNTDYIDLLYIHCWDPFTPVEEMMRSLDDVVRQGKVRYIGVSNFKAWQVMKAQGIAEMRGYVSFVAAQYQYSLVKRDIEYEFMDLMASEGLGLCPWGPLGGGFLSGKYHPDQKPSDLSEGRIAGTTDQQEESWDRRNTAQNWATLEVVESIAKEREASHAEVALAWLREKPFVSSVILGARTPEQLAQNLKAGELDLTPEEMGRLDAVSALPELYPYRMIEAYGRKWPE